MRIIFFGSSDFAIPSLKALIESHHQIEMVVTQPDRPKGRGRQVHSPSVKILALENKLRIEQPEKASNPQFLSLIRQIQPEMVVVVAYGQILSKDLLSIPTYGCINVHGSLLPRFRGASPIHQVIIEGEEKTGITTIQMDEGMDTGDILMQKEIPVLPEDTAGSLSEKLAHLGAVTLMETLTLYEQGKITPQKQKEELATYTRLLKKDDGRVDWNQPADQICRLIRGLNPWPSAFSYLNGRRVRLLLAIPLIPLSQQQGYGCPGKIIRVSRPEGLVVEAGQNTALAISQLQPENKKEMSAWEYAQGAGAAEGNQWSSK